MRKDSFRKTLSLGLGFLMRSSRTITFSSIEKHLEVIVVNCDGPIGLLPTKAKVRVWFQRKIKTLNSWWSRVTESYGHCKESNLGKVRTKLGRALPYHLGSWHQSILSGRFRRACSTMSLECKQSKEVLLLINIFDQYICSLYKKSMLFDV